MKPRSSRFAAVLVALLAAAALSAHAFSPPPPPPMGEALLLERKFDALEELLAKARSDAAVRDSRRLFATALRKLGPEDFIALYKALPPDIRGEAMAAATHAGRTDLLALLVQNGMDLNAARAAEGSVMTIAAYEGKIAVMQWAVDAGVQPLPRDAELNELTAASMGLYSPTIAARDTYPESAFRWLETRGYEPSTHPRAMHGLLTRLAEFGNVEFLDRYVRFFKTRNVFDPNSAPWGRPLLYSAHTLPILQYVEAQGASLDVPSRDRNGAIYLTNPLENHQLHRDASLYLLSKGLRPGRQALAHAVAFNTGDRELIEALLKAGADPNAATVSASPLHDVAQYTESKRLSLADAREVLALLVRSGANLYKQDSAGNLPLHIALRRCSWSALKLWLDAGHDVNVRHPKNGRTLIGLLAGNGLPFCGNRTSELVRNLVAAGADVNAGNPPPLYDLLASPYTPPLDLVDTLVGLGADINATDTARGDTVLHRLIADRLKLKEPCYPTPGRAKPCARETLAERLTLIRGVRTRGADASRPNRQGVNAIDLARADSDADKRAALVQALGQP